MGTDYDPPPRLGQVWPGGRVMMSFINVSQVSSNLIRQLGSSLPASQGPQGSVGCGGRGGRGCSLLVRTCVYRIMLTK